MKKSILFAFAIACITSCENQSNDPSLELADSGSHIIPVKVVNQICGSVIFKIQDPAFYEFGENEGGEEHVFFGRLECPSSEEGTIEEIALPTDKVLLAELDPTDFKPGCAICLAVINYSGKKHYNVRPHELQLKLGSK